MIKIIYQSDSEAWQFARIGKVTASRVADVMRKTKTGASATRANYAAELVAERLTGSASERFVNASMLWGIEKEADARALYELLRNVDVQPGGFVSHPTLAMAGASPDGFIGDEGLVEIKCPNTATHIATLIGAAIDADYGKQIQFQMACTGRKWCDFVSFDPRMPDDMQIHIVRIARDDAAISEMEREISSFLSEVDSTVGALLSRYREAA